MNAGDLVAAFCVLAVLVLVGRALYLDRKNRQLEREHEQLGKGGRGVRR